MDGPVVHSNAGKGCLDSVVLRQSSGSTLVGFVLKF